MEIFLIILSDLEYIVADKTVIKPVSICGIILKKKWRAEADSTGFMSKTENFPVIINVVKFFLRRFYCFFD